VRKGCHHRRNFGCCRPADLRRVRMAPREVRSQKGKGRGGKHYRNGREEKKSEGEEEE